MGWMRVWFAGGWLLGSLVMAAGQGVKPAFEVATIKPFDAAHGGMVGFASYPGGRVVLGASTVKMMMHFAFDVDGAEIQGGPGWTDTERYDVVAVPPGSSPSSTEKQSPLKATPSDEQRKMLQTLLAERFGLKVHRESKPRAVYFLVRGEGPLHMEAAADTDQDARGAVMNKGGIFDGEAFGSNLSMEALAKTLSRGLGRPVVDKTGLVGTYDFHLTAVDPENRDVAVAIFQTVKRLGLKLQAGEGAVETIVIDGATRPDGN